MSGLAERQKIPEIGFHLQIVQDDFSQCWWLGAFFQMSLCFTILTANKPLKILSINNNEWHISHLSTAGRSSFSRSSISTMSLPHPSSTSLGWQPCGSLRRPNSIQTWKAQGKSNCFPWSNQMGLWEWPSPRCGEQRAPLYSSHSGLLAPGAMRQKPC